MISKMRSRTGWALVVAYLLLALFAFREALTCTGWACDLAAIPAVFPMGFPIAWITDWLHAIFYIPGYSPSSLFRNWYFIFATVITNSLFYYWLGHMLGGLVNRLRRRHPATNHTDYA